MSNMQETLKNFGGHTEAWVGSGPTVALPEQDKRLCEACRVGDIEGVRKALEEKAEPSVQFRLALGEVTPIFLCASKGYIEIAKLLIEKGADIEKKMDFDGTLCLHHAASNGQHEMCAFLIEQKPSLVSQRDKLGRTALMDAAEIGSIPTINVLIDHKAEVNAEDKEHHTALSYCIDFVNTKDPKFYEAAVALVKRGADPNYSGKFANRTILHCAAAVGELKFIEELVQQRGANVLVVDNEGKTPLKYAQDAKREDIANYLQEQMAAQSSSCCQIL